MKNSGYEDLAHPVRRDFSDPRQTLEELYGRMIFNVLCGNTDDHARDPYRLLGRPDLPAQPSVHRCVRVAAMLLTGQRRDSRLTACLAAAPAFGLTAGQARTMIDHQYEVIMREWGSVCDEAGLSLTERGALWQSIKNDLTTMFWHRDARAIGHSYGGYLLMHALAELGAFPGRILLLSPVLGTGTSRDGHRFFSSTPPRAKKLLTLAQTSAFPVPHGLEVHTGADDDGCDPGLATTFCDCISTACVHGVPN